MSNNQKIRERQAASKPIEYKSFFCKEIKIDKDSRKVSGYLASFGDKDDSGEILVKGCFAKSLSERGVSSTSNRRIAYLYQHDTKQPLGKYTKLEETEKGLYFEAEISRIPLGDQVLEQYKDGTLNQHSIGYRHVWDKTDWDDEQNALVLKEVKLYEGSVVTVGANENTPFLGMKSEQLESHRNKLLQDVEAAVKSLEYDAQIEIKQLFSRLLSISEVEREASRKEEKIAENTKAESTKKEPTFFEKMAQL
jgi:HK97 family phage prohead protease